MQPLSVQDRQALDELNSLGEAFGRVSLAENTQLATPTKKKLSHQIMAPWRKKISVVQDTVVVASSSLAQAKCAIEKDKIYKSLPRRNYAQDCVTSCTSPILPTLPKVDSASVILAQSVEKAEERALVARSSHPSFTQFPSTSKREISVVSESSSGSKRRTVEEENLMPIIPFNSGIKRESGLVSSSASASKRKITSEAT